MNMPINYSKENFAIYGLGRTGVSVINYFKRVKFKNYIIYDDKKSVRRAWGINKKKENSFFKNINFVNYIIISPGIDIKKTRLHKFYLKNKHKFITDLDLFYMFHKNIKSIVVTGTNGKSTTCKIIEHILNKNNIQSELGGNIGSPVLNLSLKSKSLIIIEASSFQLSYSKFIKPDFAIILNISKDHIDWHGSMKNYLQSKLKIFSLQDKKQLALLNNNKLIRNFKKNRFKGNLKKVDNKNYFKIKKKIKNDYLKSEVNDENMSFICKISEILNIKKKSLIKSLTSFKGLSHRHEVFLKKNNKIFINDSKATSFSSTKFALKNNKNIFWIVGGLPKKGDKLDLSDVKKNIIKSYIIGKHMNSFQKYIKRKINYKLCKTLKNAVVSILNDIKKIQNKKITILLSPASASYDQFKNFEERGNQFKKFVKLYRKKYV